MAGSSAVLEDGSVLSRIERRLYRVEGAFALISGAAVLGLMVLAVVSVGGRNMFNTPLPGYVDWIQMAMPLIAFMGISYAQRDGVHIRMDILIGRLRGRPLWIAEFLTCLATLVLIGLLIWGSWAHFQRSFDWGSQNWSRDSTIDIGLPIWPAKILVPVAFSVMGLRLLLQLWGYAKGIVQGGEPAGVPLMKSAAELAAEEAEHVSALDR
ncbi:TRAP transporter small permease subunit [Pseudooceanicola sp.]|uniref:TRAP transporter small permease subunit n=1 Tax=Pseudooceanicola sp. TaxID=1914328 RepID=UPI0035C6C07A